MLGVTVGSHTLDLFTTSNVVNVVNKCNFGEKETGNLLRIESMS